MVKEAKGIRLNVKYAEKDKAKEYGARWDSKQKTWYLPLNGNSKKLAEFMDEEILIYGESPVNVSQKSAKPKNSNCKSYYLQIRNGYPCCRCKRKMRIITLFDKPPKNENNTKPHEYALVWSRPQSFSKFAETLGIPMKYQSTETVKVPYSIHCCPSCGSVQGDFYMLQDKGCILPVETSFWITHNLDDDTWERID